MDIQTFQPPFVESIEIRTIIEGSELLFVAADIAHNLGYRMASDMTRRLDQEDKGTRRVRTPSGEQDMTVITESGLYEAIMGSQVAAAKDFKRWISREVLPAIRKTGSYTTAPVPELSRLDLAKMILDAETRNEEKDRIIESQKPAVEFVADLVDTKSLTTISDAAKEFGYGPKEFAGMLEARKIIFKRTKGGPWLAKQEHLDAGRFSTKIHMVRDWAKPTTCLTGKGLVWLRSVLKPAASTFDGLFGEMVA